MWTQTRAGARAAAAAVSATRGAAPGAVHRPGQKVGPEALADELGHEAEVGQLDLARGAPVELDVPGRDAGRVEHMHLDRRILHRLGQRLVGQLPALVPQPGTADAVVEIAIERHRGPDRPDDRQVRPRWRRRRRRAPRRWRPHLEVDDLDVDGGACGTAAAGGALAAARPHPAFLSRRAILSSAISSASASWCSPWPDSDAGKSRSADRSGWLSPAASVSMRLPVSRPAPHS